MNEEDLKRTFHQWDEAMIGNDALTIGAFMTDDWVIVGSDGITSKFSFLEYIQSGLLMHNRMDSDQMHIKIYGDTGIVISRGTSAGTYSGQTFSLYEWSTSTFIWKDGKWRCVLTMLTPANKTQG
jgi:ketosteroid isomerase-like protein